MKPEIPSSRSFPLYSGCNYKIKEGQNKGKDRREKEGHPMSCLAITFTTQQINSKRQDIGATIFQRTSKRRVFFNQFINIMSIFWLSFYSRVLFLVHWDLMDIMLQPIVGALINTRLLGSAYEWWTKCGSGPNIPKVGSSRQKARPTCGWVSNYRAVVPPGQGSGMEMSAVPMVGIIELWLKACWDIYLLGQLSTSGHNSHRYPDSTIGPRP